MAKDALTYGAALLGGGILGWLTMSTLDGAPARESEEPGPALVVGAEVKDDPAAAQAQGADGDARSRGRKEIVPTSYVPAPLAESHAAAPPAAALAASSAQPGPAAAPARPTSRALLHGTVMAGGEPCAGCTVVLHPGDGKLADISVVADENGEWQIPHPPDGPALLEYLPANCLLGEGLGKVQRVPLDASETAVVARIPTAWVVFEGLGLKLGNATGATLVQQPLPEEGAPLSLEPTRGCTLPGDPALEPIVMAIAPSFLVFRPGTAQVVFDPPALEIREGEYHRVTMRPATFGTVLIAPWAEACYEPQSVLFEAIQVDTPWPDGSTAPKEVQLVPGGGELGAARSLHLLPPGRWRVSMRGPLRHMTHWSDPTAWAGPSEFWSNEFVISAGQELDLGLDYAPDTGEVSICGRVPKLAPGGTQ